MNCERRRERGEDLVEQPKTKATSQTCTVGTKYVCKSVHCAWYCHPVEVCAVKAGYKSEGCATTVGGLSTIGVYTTWNTIWTGFIVRGREDTGIEHGTAHYTKAVVYSPSHSSKAWSGIGLVGGENIKATTMPGLAPFGV